MNNEAELQTRSPVVKEAESVPHIDVEVNVSPEPPVVPVHSQQADPSPAPDLHTPMAFPEEATAKFSLRDQLHAETLPDMAHGLLGQVRNSYNRLLVLSQPKKRERWIIAAVLTVIFLLRVLVAQRWWFIAYCSWVYILSRAVLFVTPNVDPEDSPSNSLPTYENDEYRPFVSRLSEFRFWRRYTETHVISLVLTLTTLTDVPVIWQILVVYFVILAGFSIGREVHRMRKYGYAPDVPVLRRIAGLTAKPKFSR
ncbi:Retrieval of early ER protein Rer1 [Carpediemonas membranifera]|uniref:Retrieval of early ER protein Rer1 n=1 Tax=Carpediemonas membranifera TaxID=201153 RepID=A0A8J6B0S5_9EUKA|nr:Retrieval of early ER protein Rer1 [Carpediemonas membranifera]|eukprot:KAG9390494.1 Retrieval of early ER protein Rer1 [Carpediemonas membranifera]